MIAAGDADGLLHAALLYRDEAKLRAAVGEYLADAEAAGEPVLALLPASHLDALSDLIGGAGPSMERHQTMTLRSTRQTPLRRYRMLLE